MILADFVAVAVILVFTAPAYLAAQALIHHIKPKFWPFTASFAAALSGQENQVTVPVVKGGADLAPDCFEGNGHAAAPIPEHQATGVGPEVPPKPSGRLPKLTGPNGRLFPRPEGPVSFLGGQG